MPRPVALITVSSGFLGRAIAARLITRYRVVGLDTEELKPPLAGFETVLVDLTSDERVRDALAQVRQRFGLRLASVIHLAAYYDLSGEQNPSIRPLRSRAH